MKIAPYLRVIIYIYKAEKPSICLSVRPSITPITPLGLPTSTYHLSTIIDASSSYFKFVTMCECSDQIAFCSGLKTKKWRKLEQHSIKNHSHMAQWVEQLTCIQEVTGSNPAGEQIFFRKSIHFAYTFLKLTLLLGIPSTHRNRTCKELEHVDC